MSERTRIIVTGVAGRMGAEVARLALASGRFEVVGATERPGPAVGRQLAEVVGTGSSVGAQATVHASLGEALAARADAVVDFTSAEASAAHAEICAERAVGHVIGSTGFSKELRARVEAAARRAPIVLSPNFSVGVNALFALVAQAARLLGDGYDVEIAEIHHRRKKDAPSGTALRLAEVAAAALGRSPERDLTFARHGLVGERPAREIGVQALRGGDVVGDHTVYFLADGERIELAHRATSRGGFASGALRAAAWAAGRAPGLYDMADVLGLSDRHGACRPDDRGGPSPPSAS